MQISYRGRDSLYNAFKNETIAVVQWSICGIVVCIIFLWYFDTSRIINLLSIVGLVIFINLILSRIKRIKNKSFPCKLILEHQPKSIVWVYSIKTQRLPFGVSVSDGILLYFKKLDKKEYTVKVPEKDLPEIMQFLNKRLPHATFGYSSDNDQWFEADPHLLLKDPPKDSPI